MTATPHSTSFPDRLNHIKSQLSELAKLQPDTTMAFSKLHNVSTSTGTLDNKTKELIALAIAVAARCDGCIAFHAHDVLRAGANIQEVTDALGVAILMGGGPSLVYATHALEAMEQFNQDMKPELHLVDPSKTSQSAYVSGDHHFD